MKRQDKVFRQGGGQRSGENSGNQNQGNATGTGSGALPPEEGAGPSATEGAGESEDQNGDGAKERGSKNSATENQNQANPNLAAGGENQGNVLPERNQSANQNTGTPQGNTPGVAAPTPNPRTPPPPNKPPEEKEEPKKLTEEEQKVAKDARARAQGAQVNFLGHLRTHVHVLGNTLKKLATREDFQTKQIEAARKALSNASDLLDDELKEEGIGVGQPGVTDGNSKGELSLATNQTPKQTAGVLVANLNELIGQVKNSRQSAARSSHNGGLAEVSDELESAKESLETFAEKL